MKKLHGTGVALVTPFNKKKEVDFKSLIYLSEYVIKKGVDYIVILGTTGESSTLNHKEKNKIISCIQEVNKKRIPLILNISGNNTIEVVKNIQNIDTSNFEAILSVTPYYNRPSQKGIYEHFKTISENTKTKIIIYNVPLRTGSNILPETVLQLANTYKNIIGIKEASGDILQSYKILKYKPNNFSVICGDDFLSLPIIFGGGDSVISVLAQAFPYEFSKMINYTIEKKTMEAYRCYYKLFKLMNLIYKEGNPTGIKSLLSIIGICKNYMRLPLIESSKILNKNIKKAYKAYINNL